MQETVRHEGDVVVIGPVGDIDGKTAPEFTQQVLALVQPRAHIVVNLKDVPFMSSAGLRSLLLIYREAKSKHATVVLAEVNKDIRNSMAATGFLSFFVVCDTALDAIHAAS